MNFLDIIFILIIFLFAIQGFRKGLIYEVASLAGLILGIYASFHFSGDLEGYLTEYLNIPEKYSTITAFILIFIVVIIILHFIGKIIENIIDVIALGFLNKLAGSVFGIVKGIVLLSLAFLIIDHFDKELISKENKEESFLYKPIASVAPLLWQGFEEYGRDKLPDTSKISEKKYCSVLYPKE
jgi:membrane protein required for colicin V production